MKNFSLYPLIFTGVCALHVVFLAFIYTPTKIPTEKRKIAVTVQTVALNPSFLPSEPVVEEVEEVLIEEVSPIEEFPPEEEAAPSVKEATPPPPKPSPTPKKTTPKKAVAKPTKPTPQKPQLTAAQKKKLEKAKTALASLNTSTPNLKKNPSSKASSSLSIDGFSFDSLSQGEVGYADLLVGRLKASLTLPEYGAVKIQLIVKRNGQVEQVKVLESESRRNEDFVLKIMKTLSFPSFGKYFEGENQHSFTITLTNDR